MKLHKRLKLAIILLIAMLPYMAYANDSIRIAKRDSILSEITGAQMPQKSLKILSFGAKGSGKTPATPDTVPSQPINNSSANILSHP